VKAVVFDLWDTLAAWPHEDMAPLFEAVSLSPEAWAAPDHRDLRWTGPFQTYLDSLAIGSEAAASAFEIRREMTRRALVPTEGAVDVLDELRAAGLGLGLISNCSSEVGGLWDDSPFAGRFDAVVLSADVGMAKPDPRIFRLTLDRLGVEPTDAIFVGDGESGELPGAEAVGIRAIQLGDRDGWGGERISELRELLELV
jgi:HAD superfamily hydrolase (TIGR01509 family)